MNHARRILSLFAVALSAWMGWASPAASTAAELPAITLSVRHATQREGTGGENHAVFQISASPAPSQPVQVDYSTRDGSALAGIDYLERRGIWILPAGATEGSISIPLVTDSLAESDETFELLLQPSSGIQLTSPRAIGTVLDDDVPQISARDITVVEGSSFETLIRVPVALSNPSTFTVRVRATSTAGTAEPPSDFEATSGTVVFPPGSLLGTFDFYLRPDNIAEFSETIRIELSNPENGVLGNATAQVLVIDDDPTPTVSVFGATLTESTGSTTNLPFQIRLSGPSTQPVRVSYSTRNTTATSGVDYLPRIGTLVIPPGQTVAVLDVTILGDALAETDEQFSLILRNPINASLGIAEAAGRILDDDRPLMISVLDTAAPEGSPDNPGLLAFDVLLTDPPTNSVVVDYTILPRSATLGSDFLSTTGTLTFVTIGQATTRHRVTVPVVGDHEVEPNETLVFRLSQPVNAILARAEAIGTILNDDGSTLVIDDATVTERDDGEVTVPFLVRRLGPIDDTTIVSYATAPVTASGSSDFVPRSGVLTFSPGQTQAIIPVLVRSDLAVEPEESFEVLLLNPIGSTLLREKAVGRILDNDLPALSAAPVTIAEGNSGPSAVTFVLRLDVASTQEVEVDFRVEPGTAQPGLDYLPLAGSQLFPPGTLERQITITTLSDTLDEGNETFSLVLSNPRHARIATPEVLATLVDDDPAPFLSMEDSEVRECSGSEPDAVVSFQVRLSTPSGRPIQVPFQTRSVSALAGVDFTGVTNTLTFPPGSDLQIVNIPVLCDSIDERDEVFEVVLGAPDFAVLSRARARGRILDDDVPTLQITDVRIVEGTSTPSEAILTLTLTSAAPEIVAIDVATLDASAMAGSDYLPVSNTLFLLPGTTSETLRIPIITDAIAEPDEVFHVTMRNPRNVRLERDTAEITLLNDDLPSVRIPDVSVVARRDQATEAVVVFTLSQPSADAVVLPYTTVDGTAVANEDYTPAIGALTFPPGTTRASLTIAIAPNSDTEAEEHFLLEIGTSIQAVAEVSRVRVTLGTEPLPNQPPTVALHLPSWADASTAGFPIPLAATATDPENGDVTVTFHANDLLLASVPSRPFDFLWTNSLPGLFTLTARATDRAGATATSSPVTVRLLPPPTLLASSITTAETQRVALLPFSLSRAARETVRVQIATRDHSAVQGLDFSPLTATLVFQPGQTNRLVEIQLIDDAITEPTESFFVDLTSPENATLGIQQVTITVTDDDVPPPTNAPPSVAIVTPRTLDVLPAEAPVRIEVQAADPEGPISRVEFYANGTLIGTDTSSPFRWEWRSGVPGDHLLHARAFDRDGAMTDSQVIRIALAQACGRVAIVTHTLPGETQPLREFLFELGQPSEVFDSATAHADLLRGFDLVIWHDGGQRGLKATQVQMLNSLSGAGVPLYFIGDQLVESSADLDQTTQALWIQLIQLRPGPAADPVPRVTLASDELPFSVEPILRGGKVGDVSDFDYPFSSSLGTRTEPDGEWILGRAGNRDVLVALPEDLAVGQERRLTQAFQVTVGGDAASKLQRKRLFQNAVWWLLDCQHCANLNLVPFLHIEPAPNPDSAHLRVSIQVHPTGACEALDVRVTCELPPHLQFVRANAERGTWDDDPDTGIVRFALGRLRNGIDETLEIITRPVRSGLASVRVALSSLNESAGALDDNESTASVQIEGPPGLKIRLRSPAGLELEVEGQPGVPYGIESAPSPTGPWSEIFPILLAPNSTSTRIAIETIPSPRFFRVRTR
jgi:hypothetical protein